MSVVTYAHRTGELIADAQDYDQCLLAVVTQLKRLPWVQSVIVCGSYAKGSLAPGWSDLDLVVIYNGSLCAERLYELRLTGAGRANPAVPVGMDTVSTAMLAQTRRVVGRPLAMSMELKQYARAVWGDNPFPKLPRLPGDRARIEVESELLVRSDANSFLRRRIAGYASPRERLFDAVKTLLRIAMFESSALPKDGFAVPDYCSAVRRATEEPLVAEALTLAQGLREDWPRVQVAPEATDEAQSVIAAALIHYCERWSPPWAAARQPVAG